ncbi:Mbov_0392 family ICE element protein [[Mycoplasma] collis]|uniref:Mbov_0392 family ICE element protein n=1 Tax=[Mycoplasma] collis TaxID=2127 RepID=UPI00051BFBDD|nr:hypothetical protein [[Mycoplasma] collis]
MAADNFTRHKFGISVGWVNRTIIDFDRLSDEDFKKFENDEPFGLNEDGEYEYSSYSELVEDYYWGIENEIKEINENIINILKNTKNEYLYTLYEDNKYDWGFLSINTEVGYHEGQQWFLETDYFPDTEEELKNLIKQFSSKPKNIKEEFQQNEAQLTLNKAFYYSQYKLLKLSNQFPLNIVNHETYFQDIEPITDQIIDQAFKKYKDAENELNNYILENKEKFWFYGNLNDYYYKNSELGLEAEKEAKALMIDEILYQNTTEIFSYIEKMTGEEKMSLSEYTKDYDIFRFEKLEEIVDESIREEGMESKLIRLVDSLHTNRYDKNDLVQVNGYLNDLKKINEKEFLQNFIDDELNNEQLIELHQYAKSLEKQQETKDENNLIKETKDEMEM